MKVIKVIIVIALLISISACKKNEQKSEPVKVLRVGVRGVTNALALYIKYADLFKKQGINAKIEFIVASNGPALIDLFIGNKIDVSEFGDQPGVMGWLRGVDIKAVANLPSSPRDTWIMVADSQKIKTMHDLKGKKISCQLGTVTQHWLFLSLDQAGMKPSDVKMVNVPGGDATIALMNREIDAAVLGEPTISLLEERKIAAKLKGSQCAKTYSNVILVSGNIYRNHPELIKPIIAAYHDANAWGIDNPDKVLDVIKSQVTYKELPKNVLKRQYTTNRSKVKYVGFSDNDKKSFKQIVDFLKEMKAVPQHGSLADSIDLFYDSRFVDEYYQDRAKKEHTTVTEIIKRENGNNIHDLFPENVAQKR